jgi:hypothetical protein
LEHHYADLLERQTSDKVEAVQTVRGRSRRPRSLQRHGAAQAIAGEIELKQLPARLLRIAIENAGAERGSLILEHGGEFFVHTEGLPDVAAVSVVTL